jgi:hypothetical protein
MNSTRLLRRAVFTTKYDGMVRFSKVDIHWIERSMRWLPAEESHLE